MQKARSGLAAAAARWRLVEAPEGESSLQSRLNEAERRAQDAEASAQDAQAALARTLLDAARVEAVVTARIKAEAEAALEALRGELGAMSQATSTPEPASGDGGDSHDGAGMAGADAPETPVAASSEESPVRKAYPADPTASASNTALPPLRITDDDRPEWVHPDEPPVGRSGLLRFLPTACATLLSVVVVVTVCSYLATALLTEGRNEPRVAGRDTYSYGADIRAWVGGVLKGIGTDVKSVATAFVARDAERSRRAAVPRKVEAARMEPVTRAPSASPAGSPKAGWLLYMPVERAAVTQYLVGRRWPGIEMAAR